MVQQAGSLRLGPISAVVFALAPLRTGERGGTGKVAHLGFLSSVAVAFGSLETFVKDAFCLAVEEVGLRVAARGLSRRNRLPVCRGVEYNQLTDPARYC